MRRAADVIEFIEAVRCRQKMYLREVSAEAVENFICGFLHATAAFDLASGWESWNDAADARGWKAAAKNPLTLMREQGMSDEAIADEHFAILIDAVRLMLPEND